VETSPAAYASRVSRYQHHIGKVEWGTGCRSLHGFGLKETGLARFSHLLASADSMAWSPDARRKPRLAGRNTSRTMILSGMV
jgi:hypothetical protein